MLLTTSLEKNKTMTFAKLDTIVIPTARYFVSSHVFINILLTSCTVYTYKSRLRSPINMNANRSYHQFESDLSIGKLINE